MPGRAGKREQIKRLKFQAKQALAFNKDPFPFLSKIHGLESETVPAYSKDISSYKITPVDFKPNCPDYRTIPESDPRYETYRFRYLTQ